MFCEFPKIPVKGVIIFKIEVEVLSDFLITLYFSSLRYVYFSCSKLQLNNICSQSALYEFYFEISTVGLLPFPE